MTNQEINEAVARKLGWHGPSDELKKQFPDAVWNTMPDYCGDIRAAWEVVEYMANERLIKYIDVGHSRTGGYWYCKLNDAGFKLGISEASDTAPMAIALAFLKLP